MGAGASAANAVTNDIVLQAIATSSHEDLQQFVSGAPSEIREKIVKTVEDLVSSQTDGDAKRKTSLPSEAKGRTRSAPATRKTDGVHDVVHRTDEQLEDLAGAVRQGFLYDELKWLRKEVQKWDRSSKDRLRSLLADAPEKHVPEALTLIGLEDGSSSVPQVSDVPPEAQLQEGSMVRVSTDFISDGGKRDKLTKGMQGTINKKEINGSVYIDFPEIKHYVLVQPKNLHNLELVHKSQAKAQLQEGSVVLVSTEFISDGEKRDKLTKGMQGTINKILVNGPMYIDFPEIKHYVLVQPKNLHNLELVHKSQAKEEVNVDLRPEFDGKKVSALRKEAISVGVSGADIDWALNQDDAREAFIQLIVRAKASSTPEDVPKVPPAPPTGTVETPQQAAPAPTADIVDVSKICENAKNIMSTMAAFEESGLPKDWQSIRKSMFPGALREAKDVQAMFDETWTKLRKQLEAKQCLWSVDDTSFLCAPGEEEKTFKKKAELVDDSKFTSVTDALAKLNTLEGHVACPEGYCVVYSENEEKFFLLCRREISQNVLEKGMINTSCAPEGWQKTRKELFPTTNADSKDVEAMYDVYWERLRAKLVDVPLWSEALTCQVCQPGEEEASFKKKAELLNDAAVQGVAEAVKKLNTEEGHIACPEGFCVVFSQSKHCFVLLHRSDVPPNVLNITPERFSSSLPAATTTALPTASLPTVSRVSWPEARSEFFVESIKNSERMKEIEDFHKRDSVIVETSATSGKQEESVWAVNQTHELCGVGGERIFEGKAELLQKDKFKSVLEAATRLNSLEGRAACPEGYCVVLSERRQAYFLMYRADKKQEAFEKFSLTDAGRLNG